jgi:hypothetical protein
MADDDEPGNKIDNGINVNLIMVCQRAKAAECYKKSLKKPHLRRKQVPNTKKKKELGISSRDCRLYRL